MPEKSLKQIVESVNIKSRANILKRLYSYTTFKLHDFMEIINPRFSNHFGNMKQN